MSAAPIATPACETDRWLPGEYAECVQRGPWFLRGVIPAVSGPARGDVLKVRKVVLTAAPVGGRPTFMLAFDRWPKRLFPLRSFRKASRPSLKHRIAARLRPSGSGLVEVGALPIASAIYSVTATVVSQVMESGR